eukprot:1357747-Amorphochlora_amoeboformis.AAC.2
MKGEYASVSLFHLVPKNVERLGRWNLKGRSNSRTSSTLSPAMDEGVGTGIFLPSIPPLRLLGIKPRYTIVPRSKQVSKTP